MNIKSYDISRPEDWLNCLGGRPVNQFWETGSGHFSVAHFRYQQRPERFVAPPLNKHYLSMTLSGRPAVERILDGDRVEADFRPGTCLLMPANCDNAWRWTTETEEFQLFLDPGFLRQIGREAGYGEINLNSSFAFFDKTIWRYIQLVKNELNRDDTPDGAWLDSSARLLALHLLRSHAVNVDISQRCKGGLTARQLRVTEDLVRKNLHRKLRVEDLSAALGLSPFHFSREFRKETGQSPYRWIMARRIERALELLAETDMPLIEIAAETGFPNQSRFGAVFREHMGTTPSAYRRGLGVAGSRRVPVSE